MGRHGHGKLKLKVIHSSPRDLLLPRLSQAITFTAEQRRKIVHMDHRRIVGIRARAYDCTGKTTTLVKMYMRNPAIKFLLVVSNKSVKLHRKKVIPPNVMVKTANPLCPISS